MRWEADVERHGFDSLSFVFGAALAGAGLLLIAGVGEQVVTGAWIGPLAAILIGVILVIAAPRPKREAPSANDAS
jgi:hypothetical protein